MITYLIFFVLFLLQFVYIPLGTSFFEGSKVYVFEFVVLLLVLRQLFSQTGFSFSKHKTSFLIASGILLLVIGYNLLFHQTTTVFFGNQFRQQGTLLVWFLLLFAFLTAPIKFEKINKYFFFGIIAVQFFCTILFIGVGTDRPVGTLGEPNALAAVMLFVWPFLFFPRPQKIKEWMVAGIGMLLVVAIIFLSGSRSGLIALGVQAAFLFSVYGFYGRLLFPTIIGLLLLFASYITPFIAHEDLYENRAEIWVSALHAGATFPLSGVGFGNAEYALLDANVKLHNHLPGYYVDSSHNIFLDWFVQAGILGLGVLIFLLGKTIVTFVKQKQTRNLVLLLGLLAALSFNPASIVSLAALWWLIGQAASVSSKQK